MKLIAPLFALVALCACVTAEDKQLFNGKDLTGWKGLDFWTVEDGCITGRTTKEKPTKGNTFLIWEGGEVADFELTLQYKVVDASGKSEKFGNSGIQYRSKVFDAKNCVVGGYQADFECGKTYSGILYEERGRGILAQRGQKVVIKEGKGSKPEVVGAVGKTEEIQAKIKPADWNEYRVVAQGGHLQHFINGVQTIDVTDESGVGAKKGVLALQLHAGQPMTVQFKDIVLKEIK